MKLLLTFFLIAAAAASRGETTNTSKPAAPLFRFNSIAQAGTNSPSADTNATEILSDSARFDLKARTAIYLGKVSIKDPRMQLSCEMLTVKLAAEGGGKFQNILAETNVVIDFEDDKGQKIHGTGGKAVYTYEATRTSTNDVMELMDNPLLQTAQGSWRGDVITLDRINNTVKATNSRMRIPQPDGGTNSPVQGATN